MEKIEITKQLLRRGIQGRVKVHEVCRFNKEMDNFNIEKEKMIYDEDFKVLKKPKSKKVRTPRGFN